MYLSVLKAHAALHEGPQAVALVKQMRGRGLQLGRSTYSHVVHAFCNAGALQVWKHAGVTCTQTKDTLGCIAAFAVCLLHLHVTIFILCS